MQVRDLIYLLQTRSNPDSDVFFRFFVKVKKNDIQEYIIDTLDMDFLSVFKEEEDSKETSIVVNIDRIVNDLLKRNNDGSLKLLHNQD